MIFNLNCHNNDFYFYKFMQRNESHRFPTVNIVMPMGTFRVLIVMHKVHFHASVVDTLGD